MPIRVRSDHDAMYRRGALLEEDIYDITGFQIHFFTKFDIEEIITKTRFDLYRVAIYVI